MKVFANAKVNLALDVTGIRKDGYHLLDMVMAPIDVTDELEIHPNGTDRDVVYCDKPLPVPNTITKALAALHKVKDFGGYTVDVKKHIPEEAGLAGGSADAAAVLKAVNELEGLGLKEKELADLGVRVGADVPFCVYNRLSRVQGIGELVEPFEPAGDLEFLLVKPDFGISTPEAFDRWEETEKKPVDVDLVQTALETGNAELLYSTMANSLEAPAFEMRPELAGLAEEMADLGLVRVMMTGSGSALMGFSVDRDVLEAAKTQLEGKYPFVHICRVVRP